MKRSEEEVKERWTGDMREERRGKERKEEIKKEKGGETREVREE